MHLMRHLGPSARMLPRWPGPGRGQACWAGRWTGPPPALPGPARRQRGHAAPMLGAQGGICPERAAWPGMSWGPHPAWEAAKPGAGAPVAHPFGCAPLTEHLGGCSRLAPVMLSFSVSCDVQSPVSRAVCMQAADHVMDARRFEMSQGPTLPWRSALLTHPGSPSSVTDDWRPAKRHSRPQKYVSLSPLS